MEGSLALSTKIMYKGSGMRNSFPLFFLPHQSSSIVPFTSEMQPDGYSRQSYFGLNTTFPVMPPNTRYPGHQTDRSPYNPSMRPIRSHQYGYPLNPSPLRNSQHIDSVEAEQCQGVPTNPLIADHSNPSAHPPTGYSVSQIERRSGQVPRSKRSRIPAPTPPFSDYIEGGYTVTRDRFSRCVMDSFLINLADSVDDSRQSESPQGILAVLTCQPWLVP